MNIAVIFAGGVGCRMQSSSRPKQFLELNGKPVIIYTIEHFNYHPMIDAIVVVCLKDWIPFLQKMLVRFEISKVVRIVEGGETGQESIFNGIVATNDWAGKGDHYVLIHDGVRPLITSDTITNNINKLIETGSCITCVKTTETVVITQGDDIAIPDRKATLIARAPQSFRLKDIYDAHCKAIKEGKTDFIDSCTLMNYYGYKLNFIEGPVENIKITTPADFFIFRAMVEVHENQQIFGY